MSPKSLTSQATAANLPRPAPTVPDPDVPLRKYAMVLAYDGSAFLGWQVQPHGETVQGKLEAALRVLTGRETPVYGSGRTDTGVHGLNQVAHFSAAPALDLKRLRRSLNALAGPFISVKKVAQVGESFHARHSATGKTYRYQIFNRSYPPVFGRSRCWWVRSPLDVPAIRRAATGLLGTHDFSAFRSKDCAARSPVREMEDIAVEEGEWPDATLRIELRATGFLQHMARIVAGTLVEVGKGRLEAERIPAILAQGLRDNTGPTAPGQGLYLVGVRYDLAVFPELKPLLEKPSLVD